MLMNEQNVNNGVTKDSPVLILYIHLEAGAAAVSDKYTEGKGGGGCFKWGQSFDFDESLSPGYWNEAQVEYEVCNSFRPKNFAFDFSWWKKNSKTSKARI